MSPVNDLNPANGNIFPAPTNFYPPNPSQVSEKVSNIEQVSEGVNDIEPAAVSEGEETAQSGESSTRPRQNVGMYKDDQQLFDGYQSKESRMILPSIAI